MGVRVDLISPILKRYTRRFSVLDFGGGIYPAVAVRIAKEYDSVVVLAERDFHDFSQFVGCDRLICLQKNLTVKDLTEISASEHFDVVLAFNVIHWMADWEEAIRTVMGMGDHVFVQLPSRTEAADERVPGYGHTIEMLDMLEIEGMKVIGETVQFPRHAPRPVYYWKRDTPRLLTRTTMGSHEGSADTVMWTSFEKCEADMRRLGKGRKIWIPGINLWNFRELGGSWPTSQRVVEILEGFKLPEATHGDVVPWNFVIDGEQVHLVDGYQWESDDQGAMKNVIEWARGGRYA